MLPLVIRNLGLTLDCNELLHNIDLNLVHSGITIIMGHNGAGKSLLLRTMHGLLAPSAGTVQWDGNDAINTDTRKRQAMVFQKPLMLNRTVQANIDYVLQLRGKAKENGQKYLQSAGLENKSQQPARSLSGGEQQRLAIARALACEPEVLFLDEPTANLDPTATLKIEAQVKAAVGNSIKVIMVTHDIAQARRLADDIVFTNQGQVTEHTDATTFFTQPESTEARDYLSAYIR